MGGVSKGNGIVVYQVASMKSEIGNSVFGEEMGGFVEEDGVVEVELVGATRAAER